VTKIRMQLRHRWLPIRRRGYEIFDKSDTFGPPPSCRTSIALRAIEGACAHHSLPRFHRLRARDLVIPDRQIFARDISRRRFGREWKTRTRLSAASERHPGAFLWRPAVAGLTANNVALVDDKGELLAGGNDGDNARRPARKRISGFEDRLRQRVENIVSRSSDPVTPASRSRRTWISTASRKPPRPRSDSKVVRSSQTVSRIPPRRTTRQRAAVSVGHGDFPGQAAPPAPAADNASFPITRATEEPSLRDSQDHKNADAGCRTSQELSVAVVVDGTYTPRCERRTRLRRPAAAMT